MQVRPVDWMDLSCVNGRDMMDSAVLLSRKTSVRESAQGELGQSRYTAAPIFAILLLNVTLIRRKWPVARYIVASFAAKLCATYEFVMLLLGRRETKVLICRTLPTEPLFPRNSVESI